MAGSPPPIFFIRREETHWPSTIKITIGRIQLKIKLKIGDISSCTTLPKVHSDWRSRSTSSGDAPGIVLAWI